MKMLFLIHLIFSQTLFAGFRQGDSALRWPNGTVPYSIDSSLTGQMKTLVLEAMDQWEIKTKNTIQFIVRTNQTDYLKIKKHTPNHWMTSGAGNIGGVINLLVGKDLGEDTNLTSFTHELGHVLGLIHEFQRPDRDSYIKINPNLSGQGMWSIMGANSPFVPDGPYDLSSVMNYPPCPPEGCSGAPHYTAVDGSAIPSTSEISELDAEVIMKWYGGGSAAPSTGSSPQKNSSGRWAGGGCLAIHHGARPSEIGSWLASWIFLLIPIFRIIIPRIHRNRR